MTSSPANGSYASRKRVMASEMLHGGRSSSMVMTALDRRGQGHEVRLGHRLGPAGASVRRQEGSTPPVLMLTTCLPFR